MPRDDGPVTVIVRRRVHPEMAGEFERWLADVNALASSFPGHLGVEVARPAEPAAQDYVLVFRFDSRENLAHWEESPERARALARAEPFTVGTPTVERVTGLEYWFTLPGDAARRPPPRYRMAIATVAGLYPLVLFLAPAIARVLAPLPGGIGTLVSTSVMVGLMTYAVMPLLTRAFAFWLFAGRREAAGVGTD